MAYVGAQLEFPAGYVPIENLSPGKYYLQMIYYKAFIASNPEKLGSNPPKDKKTWIQKFSKNFDKDELFQGALK